MDYKIIDYIHEDKRYGSNNSLLVIKKLMNLLNNPQDELKYIHIAGTNGKGSTSSFISSILMENDYKVGLYTSPHIESFNERIKINGENISNEKLEFYGNIVKRQIDILEKTTDDTVTVFEFITAIMFVYFYHEKVDLVVLETGVGGRLDATNIVKDTMMSIITTIDFDHVGKLGDTLEKIAHEKSQIIKKDSIVISYYQDNTVKEVLKKKAEEENSDIYFLDECAIDNKIMAEFGCEYNFLFGNNKIDNVKISMLGEYQIYNSSLALLSVLILMGRQMLSLEIDAIKKGLFKSKWICRLELISDKPYILIDGAHNIQGAENLIKAIEIFDSKRIILVIAMLENKNNDEVISILSDKVDEIIVTQIDDEYRRLSSQKMAEIVSKYKNIGWIFDNNQDAIDKSLRIADENDLIIFAGSLYFAGDIRSKI